MPPGNNLSAMFGAGPPQMDTDALNRILQQYGISMPQQYAQPGPFENMPSMGSAHPAIARGLDNALIAVSLMGPTGPTAGDNISNVARGVLGVGNYRRQFAAEQAMLPIAMAGQVAGLQEKQAQAEEMRARGEYYRAMPEMWAGRDAAGIAKAGIAADSRENVADTNADAKRDAAHTKASNRFGGGAIGNYITNQLAAHYGGIENIPDIVDPTLYRSVYSEAQRLSGGFQGTQLRENTVPQSEIFNKRVAANQSQYKGFRYDIKDSDKATKAEFSRLVKGYAEGGGANLDINAIQKQAVANVAARQNHDQQIDQMWSQYNMLPVESQMTLDFGSFARSQGYDPNTRHFQPRPQAQQQSQGPLPGAAAAVQPPAASSGMGFGIQRDANGRIVGITPQ